jgi:hypothetical protein
MHGLRTLAAYFEDRRDGFDWTVFLRCLADEYRGKAGLALHRFGTQQRGEVIETAYVQQSYVDSYKKYATKNPWLPILWGLRSGELLHGSKKNPDGIRESAEYDIFYKEWMYPQGVKFGLGVNLFKDAEVNPQEIIFLSLNRSEDVGPFSDDEVRGFSALIPLMMSRIGEHPVVAGYFHRQQALKKFTSSLINTDSISSFLSEIGLEDQEDQELLSSIIKAALNGDARFAGIKRAWETGTATATLPAEAAPPPAPLPDTPPTDPQTGKPQYYRDRPMAGKTGSRESIVEFLERVWYDPYIKSGVLTRPDLRRLDGQAEMALANWLRVAGNELPAHLRIPTKKQSIDRQLSHVGREDIRQAQRLARALQRRREGDTRD